MNERTTHKFLCSFCSSCVLRETSMMVDYTDFEEERLREKKGKMFFPITSPAAHHREREEVLREIKMKRFLNFYYAEIFDFS